MDNSRFDALAKAFAAPSRRSIVKIGAGALLGLIGIGGAGSAPGIAPPEAEAASSRQRSVGNSCTVNADCASGLCVTESRTRKVCHCASAADCPAASGQCRQAVCLPTGLCGIGVTADAPCDDGNPCTTGDACQADGACVGAPISCPTLDQCHTAGVCNPATGVCSNPAKADGSACNDRNACTQTDTCQAGVCTGGNPVVCAASDQCHNAGTCDPGTGACSNPVKADGSACDDGNPCTVDDICVAGVCEGVPFECPPPTSCQVSVACNGATGTCDAVNEPDGMLCGTDLACSHDVCQSGTCVTNVPKPLGTACNDSNSCTQTDACDGAGACVGGSPVLCVAPDACHANGVCNTATGVCDHPLLPGFCFIAGVCYASGGANPANPCQDCNPAMSTSAFSDLGDGAACNDGNACTQSDVCQAGVCTGLNPVTCAALDQCHDAGVCDPQTGVCTNPPKTNGTACNDGNPCTTNDVCTNGVCAGQQKDCNDFNPCTIDSCDAATGACVYTAVDCDDDNPCTIDSCDPQIGCVHTPKICPQPDNGSAACNPATGACDLTCAGGYALCGGVCVDLQNDDAHCGVCGTACGHAANATYACVAGSCQIAACDAGWSDCDNNPATGCETDVLTSFNHCGTCDIICLVGQTCVNGVCTNPDLCAGVTCVAQDQCHSAGVCNPATGVCSNPANADGSACNDGNACTQTDTCQAGVCTGGNPVTCVAQDQCHTAGTCNPATGLCSNPPKTDGATCFDGNPCTLNDVCQSGVCVPGATVICTAVDQCHTAGVCDPSSGSCTTPEQPNGTSCSGGSCCNGSCCASGSVCCGGGGSNSGCCAGTCCGNICCGFSNSANICCPGGICVTGPLGSTPTCPQ